NKALGLCKTLARHHANRRKVRIFKLRPLIEISFPDRRLSDGGDACSSQARLIVVGFKIRLKRCPTSRQLPVQHKSLYIKGPSGSFIGQKAGLPVLRNLGRGWSSCRGSGQGQVGNRNPPASGKAAGTDDFQSGERGIRTLDTLS